MNKLEQRTVFFDGACHLCAREIAHYKRIDRAHALSYIDISKSGFNAGRYELDAKQVRRHLHVLLPNGEWAVGVAGFQAIWDVIPSLQWLASISRRPIIYWIMTRAYAVFAAIRPFLPRKKCDEGVCSI